MFSYTYIVCGEIELPLLELDNIGILLSCLSDALRDFVFYYECLCYPGRLISNRLRCATYQYLQLLRIYHAQVTTALQEINDFEMKIIAYSSERLYNYLMATHPIIIQQVPAKYIAEFMGISSEWLSKLKHRI